jgi:hypothetical protein
MLSAKAIGKCLMNGYSVFKERLFAIILTVERREGKLPSRLFPLSEPIC